RVPTEIEARHLAVHPYEKIIHGR
ncbi:MAG: hypothetical protein QOE61_1005, partial [Micromonosporaceae bacterium]|nr:hypothetical protein [Micromonosporaceae bacterium]